MEEKKCKLVREDGLVKESMDFLWIEFDDDGRFKESHKEAGIGRSLLLSPFNLFFTWQTTLSTEIIENTKGFIKFRTKKSLYEFYYQDLEKD